MSFPHQLWKTLLNDWISDGTFDRALATAFQASPGTSEVNRIREILQADGSSEAPEIVELNSGLLRNRLGAYSRETNTIYIDYNLSSDPSLLVKVLAHELGHWIDGQLNTVPASHEVVRSFASILLAFPLENTLTIPSTLEDSTHPSTITLPSGETINASFFDTGTHTDWIKNIFKFLSTKAVSLINRGEEETDAFNSLGRNYGLQTNSASHFDFNNITGGIEAVKERYESAIRDFNKTEISLVDADPYTGGNNRNDPLPNPQFTGDNAGVELLLYRFSQICHGLEDFYAHSNWVELVKEGHLRSNSLLLPGLDLPDTPAPGDYLPGTNVVIAESGPDWSKLLIKSGTGNYSGTKVDVYWEANSKDPEDGGGVLKATKLDGSIIYGLATGGVNYAIYKDLDRSVYFRDPTKTGFFQKEYFRGFGHGGIAGEGFGQRVSPLNKDKASNTNFEAAMRLSNLQTKNEWDRLGNLIFKNYGVDGLRRFANYAFDQDQQVLKDAYISIFSKPGGRWFGIDSAEPLGLMSAGLFADSQEREADITSLSIAPPVRMIQVFSKNNMAETDRFATNDFRLQFFDVNSGAWYDTDFVDFNGHHPELSADELAQLTTPSAVQHITKGERAVWTDDRPDSLDQQGNIYYVDADNEDVTVYIANFDLAVDRIVFVDSDGIESSLPDELYSPIFIDRLRNELSNNGVVIDFHPISTSKPGIFHVLENQLDLPLTIKASDLTSDSESNDLVIVGYDDAIPFLSLVEGKLQASSIDPKYVGQTFLAYVDIFDGVSATPDIPVRVSVAPKVILNGANHDSDSIFNWRFTKTTDYIQSIYVSITDADDSTLDTFTQIAASVGDESGVPQGAELDNLIIRLSDAFESGRCSFWLKTDSDVLEPLALTSLSDGGYAVFQGSEQLAEMIPVTGEPEITPVISQISIPGLGLTMLGLRLNQNTDDLISQDSSSPTEISLALTLSREASFTNEVGLILVDRFSGQIIDAATGILGSDLNGNWQENVESYAIWRGTTADMQTTIFNPSFALNGDIDLDSVVLIPYLKSTVNNETRYFSTSSASNPDSLQHATKLAGNIIGFEDVPEFTRGDFDDIILQFDRLSISNAAKNESISSLNWMSGLPDRSRLFDLFIPGAHDAATFNYGRFGESNINYLNNKFAMTQDTHADIATQLNSGIRYFDFRFGLDKPEGSIDPGGATANMKLYHNVDLRINLKECLDPIKAFLEANPSEVVFVSLQPDPDQPSKNQPVSPGYIRHIFEEYKSNNKLPTAAEIQETTGYKLTGDYADPSNLFVESWRDFETIRQLRPYKGLGGLGDEFNLTAAPYSSSSPIGDPRDLTVVTTEHNVPILDYSGLALGDVRGKIILVQSEFKQVNELGWLATKNTADLNINPLDRKGRVSTGSIEQDNWEAPGYQEKKDLIRDFALGLNANQNIPSNPRALPLNFTSASSSYVGKAPSPFALIINAGLPRNSYRTDGTDTLASFLNRNKYDSNALDGLLTAFNLDQKLSSSGPGLKGIMLGDFYTTSRAWYNEFWGNSGYTRGGIIPSPNSDDYPASDWLTSKIWRQSAVITPIVDASRDLITGLPMAQEGQRLGIQFQNYLGDDRPAWSTPQIATSYTIDGQKTDKTFNINYRITMIDPEQELGLSNDSITNGSTNAATLRIRSGDGDINKVASFGKPGDSIDLGFTVDRYVNLYGGGNPGVFDGNHFYRVEMIADGGSGWSPFGTPVYFWIQDL